MIKFHKLELKNCIYFKDVTLPLDSGGVTIINGKNLRSREKDQSNGAGKSLLFSYIPNILFANPPLAIRSNMKRDLLGDHSIAALEFSLAEKHYRIVQAGGRQVSYEIYEDGKLINPKTTATKSEEFIASLVPFSEAEFYTLDYLNSQREFVFQRGKSEARLAFVTEFFRLDYYDKMKSYFQEELKKIKKVEIEVAAYESQRLKLVEDKKELDSVERENLDDLDETITQLKEKRKKAQKKLEKVQAYLHHLSLRSQLLQSIGGASKPDEDSLKALQEELAALEREQKVQERILTHKNNIQRAKKTLLQSRKNLENLFQEVLGTSFSGNPYKIDPEEGIRLKELAALRKKYLQLQEKSKDIAYEPNLPSLEDILAEIAEKERVIKSFQNLKNHMEDERCPVCGSLFDFESLKISAKDAKIRLQELQDLKERKESSLEYERIQQELKTLEKHQSDFSQLDALLDSYRKKTEHYDEMQEEFRRWRSAEQEITQEEERLAQEESKLQGLEIDKIESLRSQWYNTKKISELYSRLEALDATLEVSQSEEELEEEQQKLQNFLEKLEIKIEDLSARRNRIAILLEKEKLIKTKLKEVNDKIEELSAITNDREIVETLIKVYSNKGIKIQKVDQICRLLEKNLNHFKSLLFGENFKFQLVVNEKEFDVIVDRGDGIISDVRNLSGSESRRFNLLLLISLLPLTPEKRRSNLVILDEMESNSDETTLKMFCERFIPELQKFIPNVFVVTPLSLRIPGAKRYYVVKDAEGSHLEEDFSLEG